MKMRLTPFLVCLALAGCTGHEYARSVGERAPSDTALGECQRQAYNDPKVQALLLQNFTLVADPAHDFALRQARIDATNACLRSRGITVPGGVEPVNRGGYLL
jgi:hypothetical protein